VNWKLIALFGCEGCAWHIYRQSWSGEIVYCSTSIDWPGDDDWVENIYLKGPRLEDVLPESWVLYCPGRVTTVFVAIFQEAYLQAHECLAADVHRLHGCEDRRWREVLGLPEREEGA
jgi:hypothetical protein